MSAAATLRIDAGTSRRALILALPLLFLTVFFIWPLVGLIPEAVADPAVSRVLVRSAPMLCDWTDEGTPPVDVQAAFVTDLRKADDRSIGEMTARLNSEQAGFRTLMRRTVHALRADPAAEDLAAIHARWSDPVYWQAIRRALGPYTDANLLAAFDLARDADGAIRSAADSSNRDVLLRTLVISGTVMLICAGIGYPYALLISRSRGALRSFLFIAVVLPAWTSLLVRTAGWMIILPDQGLINLALRGLGLTDAPLPLMYNRVGTVIAMTHVMLPLMVLPVYAALNAIPPGLTQAAGSLGARPLRAFREVTLPLSLRGLAAGCLLVFMSAIGYYITPALIGGPKDQMVSSIIAFYASKMGNWGMASALSIVVLLTTAILYIVYDRTLQSGARGQ